MSEQKGAKVIDLMAALKASLAVKMDELHESPLAEERQHQELLRLADELEAEEFRSER